MKKLLLLLVASLAGTAFSSAATLIQLDFESAEQITGPKTIYRDRSGGLHDVTFNRKVAPSTNVPFVPTHPDYTNSSGSTKYNATTTGAVAGASTIDLNITKTFTMEGWVYLEDFATVDDAKVGATIWSLGASGTTEGTSSFTLKYDNTGTVFATFYSRSQEGGTRTITTTTQIALESWTHVAYVKTINSVELYLNGVPIGSLSEPGITDRALPTSLKSMNIGSNVYGQFDDFRLSDVALTPDQLGYHTPFTTIPEPSTTALLIIAACAGVYSIRRKGRSPLAS